MREDEATYPFWIDEAADGGTARLGLAESFLETIAAEIVGLELSGVGKSFVRGDTLGFLHTATGMIDLRAPARLELLALNPAALADARLVRTSPYYHGWLAQIRLLEP